MHTHILYPYPIPHMCIPTYLCPYSLLLYPLFSMYIIIISTYLQDHPCSSFTYAHTSILVLHVYTHIALSFLVLHIHTHIPLSLFSMYCIGEGSGGGGGGCTGGTPPMLLSGEHWGGGHQACYNALQFVWYWHIQSSVNTFCEGTTV